MAEIDSDEERLTRADTPTVARAQVIRRKTDLTPELAAVVLAELRAGHPVTVAVDVARIHRNTFYGWIERGEGGQEPYASFLADVNAARAGAQGKTLDRIEAAGERSECPTCTCENKCEAPGDWKALAWKAERLYPELQLTQKLDVQVQKSVQSMLVDVRPMMSQEAYAELVSALARLEGVSEVADPIDAQAGVG